MKSKLFLTSLVTAALPLVASASFILSPIADATVEASQPDSNFGSDTAVRTSLSAPFGDGSQKAWLLFDGAASGYATITDIVSLTATTAATSVTQLRGAQFWLITGAGANDWNQSTITWNNAPGNDITHGTNLDTANFTITLLGETPQADSGGETVVMSWETGAKTALLNELNTGNRLATIVTTRISTSGRMNYASLEHPTADPVQLEVIPEPSSFAMLAGLMALGLIAVKSLRRRHE